MPRFHCRPRWVLVPALLLLLAPAVAANPAVEASIRHLRKAVVPHRNGTHLLLLSSLRQLRDPTLRSFFYQLAQRDGPFVRVHAILGLAEIDESGHIDSWLITQLDSPEARHVAIAAALETGLIDTAQIKQLLAFDDLEARSRVLLLAELVARGEPAEKQTLGRLAENPTLSTAALAACVLAQVADDDALSTYRARVAALPADDRTRHLLGLFDVIENYKLTAALEWVVQTIEEPNTDPQVVAKGISTLLALDPPTGVALWSRTLGNDPPYGKCVRFALLLLAGGPKVPASAYNRLPTNDEVIDRMVRAGKAISAGADASGALIELLQLSHPSTTRRVMEVVEDLDDEQAARVYLHLMGSVESDPQHRIERAELAKIAAARLFQIDPEAVTDRLVRAEDDSLTQQAILMGLLESRSPAAGEAAGLVRRIGFGRSDSLALILIAKHAKQLSDEQLHQLGVIASGGGRVSDVLQAQAAWLYLKHTAKIERALTETFADAESH